VALTPPPGFTGRMTEIPNVSIVIVAHSRRNYLRRAMDSLVAQVGARRDAEIILVKDFEDPPIEELVERHGGRCVLVSDGPTEVGRYLSEGIKKASGEVVCFLDDDDSFSPDKIANVEREFAEDPSLIYLHNAHRTVDDGDSTVHSVIHRSVRKADTIPIGPRDFENVARVVRHRQVTNLSSVSVRRAVLLPYLDRIRPLSGATDFIVFYICLASDGELSFSPRVLSNYYIHPSSMRPGGLSREAERVTAELAAAQRQTHMFGVEILQDPALKDLGRALVSQWDWLLEMMARRDNGALVRVHRSYLARAYRIRPRFVAMSLPLLLVEAFSPTLAAQLFLRTRAFIEA